jgi:hypothetical protein
MGRKILVAALLVALFLLIAFLTAGLPTADFYANIYPAARNALSGHSPYDGIYISAPWGIVPMIPFALLPPLPAHGLYFATCLYILVYIAWRLRASPLTIVALILSPTAIGALLVGNLDAVVISGMLFPPILGLLILMIKPQIGTGVALYYVIDFVRKKRWLEGLKAFSPVAAAYSLALIFFPIWYIRAINNPANIWNRSLFPYAIPLGLFLLWLAVRHRNPYFALASTAFLAPYLTFYTYIIVQIGLLHEDVEKYVRRDVLHMFLTVFLWVIMLRFKL